MNETKVPSPPADLEASLILILEDMYEQEKSCEPLRDKCDEPAEAVVVWRSVTCSHFTQVIYCNEHVAMVRAWGDGEWACPTCGDAIVVSRIVAI